MKQIYHYNREAIRLEVVYDGAKDGKEFDILKDAEGRLYSHIYDGTDTVFRCSSDDLAEQVQACADLLSEEA